MSEDQAPAIASSDSWNPIEKALPTSSNPFAMRPYVYTIATPDMDASVQFYVKAMGHEIVGRGTLDKGQSSLPTAGPAGRAYTLLRHRENITTDRGVIRLLAAPNGAKPNRPRPEARIVDPGLAIMEGHPGNAQIAWEHLNKLGVKTVTGPEYYFFGPATHPWNSSNTFSAFGPAGEQMFLSCQNVPDRLNEPRPVPYTGIIGPIRQHTLMCFDRWPVLDFYETVFGMTQTLDRFVKQESINRLTGAPEGTYYRFIKLDSGELWEFRQWRPTPKPPWPTDIDKTGLAMVTLQVDSLSVVRARVQTAGIPVLGEGALPVPDAKTQPAIYIRGAVGELIEIVGRA